MKTEEIVRSLRWCGTGAEEGCGDCAFEPQCDEDAVGCVGGLCDAAADKIEELVERCARYAEEIAALREMQKWVDVREKLPERDGHYLCRYVFRSGGKGFFERLTTTPLTRGRTSNTRVRAEWP